MHASVHVFVHTYVLLCMHVPILYICICVIVEALYFCVGRYIHTCVDIVVCGCGCFCMGVGCLCGCRCVGICVGVYMCGGCLCVRGVMCGVCGGGGGVWVFLNVLVCTLTVMRILLLLHAGMWSPTILEGASL